MECQITYTIQAFDGENFSSYNDHLTSHCPGYKIKVTKVENNKLYFENGYKLKQILHEQTKMHVDHTSYHLYLL